MIPPPLATLILDTNVGEPWIEAITEFERRLVSLKLRARVKAARDMTDVAEGLRIVVCHHHHFFDYALIMIHD